MVDSPRDPANRDAPGNPRWVKAVAIAAIIIVLLVVVVMVISGGEHGPGRHAASADAGGQTRASSGSLTAGGVGGPADAGEGVAFVVIDPARAVHESTLGDAAMQPEHADAMAHMPDGTAHALRDSCTQQLGETRHLTCRFRDTGTLEYSCHEPGHCEAGMCRRIAIS